MFLKLNIIYIHIVLWPSILASVSFFQEIQHCRFTSLGKEFIGKRMISENGKLCEHWNNVGLKHLRISSFNFPEGNATLAENFCRNPTNLPKGPWCHIKGFGNQWEYCNIPICENGWNNCRDTVKGFEYTGNRNVSKSGKKCLTWMSMNRTFLLRNKTLKLEKIQNHCRNLDDKSEPWCYVVEGESIKPEICDVPLCAFKLSQQEYFGRRDVFSETVNQSRVIHFPKLLNNLTLIVTIEKENWDLESQKKTSVWSTDYHYECQRDIDQYHFCEILKVEQFESQINYTYSCKNPLKSLVILSPWNHRKFQYLIFPGPLHTTRSELPYDIKQYKIQISLNRRSKIDFIPLLSFTGYFFLLYDNAFPYALSGPNHVTMVISRVGKGKIGFIANENYLHMDYDVYMKGFYEQVLDYEKRNGTKLHMIQVDEHSLISIKNKILSHDNHPKYLAIWQPDKELNELQMDVLLSLIREGLRLIVAMKPWSYDYYVEKLERSSIRSLFIAGGLWPSLKYAKTKMKILKRFQLNSLPLTQLLNHALTGMEQLEHVSESISDALQSLPQTENSFYNFYKPLRHKLSLLFTKFLHFTRSLTPCFNKPLTNQYTSQRKFLRLINVILLYPLGNSFRAPGLSFYPGIIANLNTDSIESVILELNVQFSDEVIYLGYYLPPGRIMEVNAWIAKSQTCRLHINYHLFDIWDSTSWMKWPGTKFDFKIRSNELLSISFAFGGLLAFSCEENKDMVHLSLSGVVSAPMFDSRYKVPDKSWKDKKSKNVPWIILANDVAIFILPAISLRNLDDPTLIMNTWNFMIKQQFHLKGRKVSTHRRELISTDIQLIGGYMHSGYPIGTQLMSVVNPRDVKNYLLADDYIRQNGTWGLLHEIGHNLQDPLFTFAGSEEVTTNIFTLVALETSTGINSWSMSNGWVREGNISNFIRYINHGTFEDWKTDTYLALGVYAQLKDNFGWEIYRQIFRKYNKLKRIQLSSNEAIFDKDRIHLWIKETSRLTQLNLFPFYELWRFPIDDRIEEELKIYSPFLPKDFLTEMVNESINKIMAKYGGSEIVLRKPKQIEMKIGPLLNPFKIEGKPSIVDVETVESE